MAYQWNPAMVLQAKDDAFVFVNPVDETWLKGGAEVKELVEDFMAGKEIEGLDPELKERILQRFIRSGMIVEKGAEVADREQKIKSIYLYLTKICNMQCAFCSMESGPADLSQEEVLSLAELKEVIDDLSRYQIDAITLTGGEPLLRKDLFEILSYLREKLGARTKIFLCSNGLLLNKDLISKIKGQVSRIDISLENIFVPGGEEEYHILLPQLKEIKKQGINLGFSFVMTKENWERVFEYIDLVVEFDATMSIKCAAPIGRGRENDHLLLTAEEILEIYRKIFAYIYEQGYDGRNIQELVRLNLSPAYSCSAKGKILNIAPDGQVFSCHSLQDEPFLLGHIYRDGVEQVLAMQAEKSESEAYHQYFHVDQRTECQGCEIRYFCTGGCFAEIYQNEARQGQLPPECGIKKVLVNKNLWGWNYEESFLENLKDLTDMMVNYK